MHPQPHYTRPRPFGLYVGMATAAIVLICLVVLFGQIRAWADPDLRAAAAAERWRQDSIDARLDWLDTLVSAGWRVLPLALVSGAGVVALGIAWRRYGQQASVYADKQVALMVATKQTFPRQLQTLNVSYHDSHKTLPSPELPMLAGPAIAVPTMAALLDSGAIGPDADGRKQPLILGYGPEGAITGDWRSLYSSGIGGLQGSGKTWGASFLLAQSALAGARLVVCDPHARDSESLAARVSPLSAAFVCDIAEDDRSILSALRLADDVLQGRKKGDSDRTPVIVAIDEWASLRRGELATVLPRFVEDFSTEGRKLNCHLLLLSQRWDKPAVGDFRNTLASSYVYRMRADEARMMTGLRAGMLPEDTLQLQPGECYLLNTHGQLVKVRIPQMTSADLANVGRRLGATSDPTSERGMGFRPPRRPEGATEGANSKATSSPPGRAETMDAEAARALALIRAGKGLAEVIKELYGVSGGRLYQEKTAWLMEVIRQALALQAA